MIIITDANGNLQAPTIPENVYQGSNNANSIVFLSPLAQSNTATIAYRLPNGLLTPEYLMTPYTSIPSQYNLNAWVRDIDEDITALYGTVTFQVRLKNASGKIISNIAGTFNVLRGVAPLPSTTPSETNWSEILTYLAQINSDIENGWLVSKGILPYDETFTYPLNASVWNKTNNTIYTSLVANNIGNALTDTSKWGATSLVSTGDIADIYERLDTVEETVVNLGDRVDTAETKVDNLESQLNGKVDKTYTLGNVEQSISHDLQGVKLETKNTLHNNKSSIIVGQSVATYTKTNNQGTTTSGEIATKNDLTDFITKEVDDLENYYTKEEVDTIVQNINAIQIRNVNNEAINATSSTVQSVATQYIVDNYERQPKQLDGLIITLTDQSNDKVLFVYSETSSIWINVGLNGVDLSNYYTKQETQQYVSQEDNKYIGREQLLGFTVNSVENEVATAVLDSSLSDYSMTNSTGYLFDVVVPTNLATLITKTTKLVLKDKDNNSININCVFEDDKDNSSTFGMLEQITTSSNAGLELEFYGHYSQFTESETVHRVIYTDTVVKGVELVKLEFDGMDIKLDGEVMNYASLRAIMINKLKFATIYYEDFACIYYPMADGSGDAIFFQSVYTINGKNYIGRIIINSDDDIQTTDIEVFNVSGITQTIDSSSTTSQVPSAKAVYDIIGNIDTLLTQIDSGSGV